MSQSKHLSSEFYNFYDMDKYKTYPDLFASERESDPVSYQTKYQMNTGKKDSPSKHQLNIILPNNRAWVSNSNFENDVPSNKVFATWLAEFDKQIPQDVGDVKPKFFVPREVEGITQMEKIRDENDKTKFPNTANYPKSEELQKSAWRPSNAIYDSTVDNSEKKPHLSNVYGVKTWPVDTPVMSPHFIDQYDINVHRMYPKAKTEIRKKLHKHADRKQTNKKINNQLINGGSAHRHNAIKHFRKVSRPTHYIRRRQPSYRKLTNQWMQKQDKDSGREHNQDPPKMIRNSGLESRKRQPHHVLERGWVPMQGIKDPKHFGMIKVGDWNSPALLDNVLQV